MLEEDLTFNSHLGPETLEEYCFHRLADAAAEAVEEHILVCSTCQETLQDVEEYIVLMKAAVARPSPASRGARWTAEAWARVTGPVGAPGLVPGTFLMVVLGLLAAVAISKETPLWHNPSSAQAATVQLTAFRGGEDLTMTPGPAGQPLDLSIDVTDLPASGAYRLTVVSAQGRSIWETTLPTSGTKLTARIPKGLWAGVYWVRIYSPPPELLREFGLKIR